MDASAYMEQLQLEAQNLKAELGQVESKRVEQAAALSTSLSAYVASLPEDQLKVRGTQLLTPASAICLLYSRHSLLAPRSC